MTDPAVEAQKMNVLFRMFDVRAVAWVAPFQIMYFKDFVRVASEDFDSLDQMLAFGHQLIAKSQGL